MKKRWLSLFLLVFVFAFSVSMLCVTTNAATGVESGTVQDTSGMDNGVVNWSFAYDTNKGTATLTLSGDGYMPDGVYEETWLPIQQEVQCYITKVVIEEGVKGIMQNAFYGEVNLQEISLPSSLVVIGENALSYTSIESLYIPENVNYLCPSMFTGSPIKDYTVSENNAAYSSANGFVYSKDMSTLVLVPAGKWEDDSDFTYRIPSAVTQIGAEAFSGVNISKINIPSNVKRVRVMAFFNTPLEEVTFENGVEMLYDSVFLNCPYLEQIHLPTSLTYIGRFALGYNYEIDYGGASQYLTDCGVLHPALNYYNISSYLAYTDATLDMFLYPCANTSFKIYAPTDSASYKYAQNNGLKFAESQALMPILNKAECAENGVTVSWSRSGDADGYYVYRRTDTGWTRIATINDSNITSYTDSDAEPLTKNIYTVRAFNAKGNSTYNKNGISCYYVEAPKAVKIKNTVKGTSLSWESSSGNEAFYVYRKTSTFGSWQYIGKVSGDERSFVDTSVVEGKRYLYTVKAKSDRFFSSYDDTGVSVVFINAPVITKAYNTANSVAVRWTYSGDADSFRIYRKTNNSSWKLVKTVDGSKRAFYDGKTQRGAKCKYTVRAVVDGNVSGYYAAGKTTISMESPFDVTVKNTVSGVHVEWNKCDGAKGYYVYRKTTGGWKRIATVKGSSGVTYTDKTAKNGTKYYYTVKAYNSSYVSTYNSVGFDIRFISTPRLTSGVSTKQGVKITYNAVANCDGYYVYRKTPGSSWKKIGTVKKSTATSYVDNKAAKGKTYVYTVKAYDGEYTSSHYASGVKVKDKY